MPRTTGDRAARSQRIRDAKLGDLRNAIEIYEFLNKKFNVYDDDVDWERPRNFARDTDPKVDASAPRAVKKRHSAMVSRLRALTRDEELVKRLSFLVRMHVYGERQQREREIQSEVAVPDANARAASDMFAYVAQDFEMYEPGYEPGYEPDFSDDVHLQMQLQIDWEEFDTIFPPVVDENGYLL